MHGFDDRGEQPGDGGAERQGGALSTSLAPTRLIGFPKLGAPADPATVGAKAAAIDAIARTTITPPGFAIPCDAAEAMRAVDASVEIDVDAALAAIERVVGRRFGDRDAPLLLSVRLSSLTPILDVAPAIIGVGAPLDAPVAALDGPALAIERAFWRSFARALATAGDREHRALEEAIEEAHDAAIDDGCDAAHMTARLRDAAAACGVAAPTPRDQLIGAIQAMARSWDAAGSIRRRAALQADDRCGVLVQALATGLAGDEVGVGRLALFEPSTGAPEISGRFRAARIGDERLAVDAPAVAERSLGPEDAADPMVAAAARAAMAVETALGAPHEVEFVACDALPSDENIVVVSARPMRLTAQAALRIAADQADAGRITRAEAVRRVPARSLEELLHESLAPDAPRDRIAHGIAAAPGAAAGKIAFTTVEAENIAQAGDAAILIRDETAPEDILGMRAAAAVVTTRGGLTSHAAVVARGLGTPCVVGAADAELDLDARRLTARDGRVFGPGDEITVDGSSGDVLAGRAPTRRPELTGAFAKIMAWADDIRRLRVRANADTPSEADAAQRLGVDGIGLCRTEHMFFDPERITVMREMILTDDADERRAALARLLPMQRADFVQLFMIMGRSAAEGAEAMDAPPVTIRLLDPPLNEFLPQSQEGLERLADAMGRPVEIVARRAADLREFNPMLGKRGCRVGVAFPEIYEMQARAIFEAALEVEGAVGRTQRPEIMVPLVSAVREFEVLRERIDAVAEEVRLERSARFDYSVGIMVETPRAALRAHSLGAMSSFFSFGTNDLTQMTYGLSRDDAGRLMRDYVERGVFEADPFQSLDQDGVGELIGVAIDRGRAANPDIAIGLCGEHGGDPATIAFCENAGFDYVSCSPYRTPIARLAAAQAALAREERQAASPSGAAQAEAPRLREFGPGAAW